MKYFITTIFKLKKCTNIASWKCYYYIYQI
jgi:hypothetical protein